MLAHLRNSFALAFLVPNVFAELFGEVQHVDRRSNTTTIPSPLIIPASQYWDGDNGEWSSFALRVGTPAQLVRVLVSTNSPETLVVFSEGCTTQAVNPVPQACAASRGGLFIQNSSSTWQKQGLYGINGLGVGLEANLGYSQNAEYGLETLGLGYTVGANGPTLQRQTVSGIATVSPFYLGIFGLSTQPVNYSTIGNYSAPSFFTTLRSQELIPSLSWSYTAGAKYRLKNGQYAQLIFGGYDRSRFSANAASFNLAGDINRDIVVSVQSIQYSGTTQSILLSTPIYSFIESTDTNLWLPAAACDAFVKAFGLSLDNSTGLYLINNTHYAKLQTEAPEVTFTIANSLSGGQTVSIVLPFSAFTLSATYPFTPNDTYYFPLKKATNDTQYTLGRTFLQEAYLTVDYERGNFSVSQCLWNDGAVSDIVPIVSSSYKSTTTASPSGEANTRAPKSRPGILIGGIIGSIAILGLFFIGFFLYRRKSLIAKAKKANEDVTLDPVDKPNEDGKMVEFYAPETPAPGYKKIGTDGSIYRAEDVNSELAVSGEIYQLPEGGHGEEDYISASHRMISERRAANTHEIAGTALVYEMQGDLPTPVEMDDENSRRLLSVSNPGSRPTTRGSENSRARNTSPVPTCLTT